MMTQFTESDLREMVLRLAHQIRNPLATIKSGIQLVEHILQPEGEVGEYLDAALLEVDRINRTVVDMQRMIRLDSATAVRCPVAEIVEEAMERCSAAAREAGTEIESAGGPSVQILADRSQIVEAVTELLMNAIEFSCRPEPAVVRWHPPDRSGMIRIDVEDACGGIPEEMAGRLLSPFFSTSIRGTGLGLNIVQRICGLAGGRLEWRNLADGSGCRFSIVLPEAG